MGEKQETEQPNAAKRPSPNSVKELLDIVHLQQANVPLNIAVKQDAGVLSSRTGLNPLPAIGQISGPLPPGPSSPQSVSVAQITFPAEEELTTRIRANSDGSQYKSDLKGRHRTLSSSTENGNAVLSSRTPREGYGAQPVPSPPGRAAHHRRERTLPPLSELKTVEGPQSRQRGTGVADLTPLRRSTSGDGQSQISSVNSRPTNEEHMRRPKSSHGRRRPLPSETIAAHNAVPASYDKEIFTRDDTSHRAGGHSRKQDSKSSQPQNLGSRLRLERPKSSKGRTRTRIMTTGSLSQGDEWSSEEDVRPRAPSPPSPGLDSDLESDSESYDNANGRHFNPR